MQIQVPELNVLAIIFVEELVMGRTITERPFIVANIAEWAIALPHY